MRKKNCSAYVNEEHQRRLAVEQDLNLRLRQQEATAQLGEFALSCGSQAALFDEAVRVVSDTLGMEYGKVLELLPGGHQLLLRAGVGWKEGLVGSFTVGTEKNSQAGFTLMTDEPVIVHDLRTETRFKDIEMLGEHEVISGMSVVIRGRERPFGVLSVHTADLRIFVPHDTRFIKTVASILGSAIERFRAEDELRRSHDELSIILEGISEGVTLQDGSGRLVYANPAAAQLMGYNTPEDALAGNLPDISRRFELLDDEGRPISYDELPGRLVLQGAPHASSRVRFRTVETGQDRWSIVDATPVRDANGQPVQSINIFRDITEITMKERHQRFLVEAGSLLSSSLDYKTTLTNLAHLAVTDLADWCSVTLALEDSQGIFNVTAHKDPARMELARAYQQRFPPSLDTGGIGLVLSTGEAQYYPIITDDMISAAVSDPEQLEMARALGMRSAIIVPLKAHNVTFGAITFIWADSGRRYTEHDVDLANELARRASMAIENARLFQEAQALNIKLETLVVKRTEQLHRSNERLAPVVEGRRRAEEALRKSEVLLNSLFESAPDAMILVDRRGRIVRVNQQAEILFKYSRDTLEGKPIDELIPDRYRDTHPNKRTDYFHKMVTRSMGRGLELFAQSSDGGEIPVDIMLSPVDTSEGQLTICAIRDITEQKRLQSELAEIHRRLFESIEAERLSLSQELHDGPIQDLYGVSIYLETLRESMNDPSDQAELESTKENVQTIIQSLRSVCGELRPPTLAHFGLEKAVRSHLARIREAHPGIQFNANLTSDGSRLSERIRLALYRVYQNAISNIIRHAQASQVDILFRIEGGEIHLVIQDDGRGFNVPERLVSLVRTGHFGLVGMTERIEAIGGQIVMHSEPGKGTTIQVIVPLETPMLAEN